MSSTRAFITDWEGPFGKNDYALELSDLFIPNGNDFFTLLSRYDDILADVLKWRDYGAGDTLKLILPFLKAYGATNEKINQYSMRNARLLSHAIDTLRFIQSIMPSYIISSSYCLCLDHLSEHVDSSQENVYCTELDIDKYILNEKETKRLREIANEIGVLIRQKIKRRKNHEPLIRIPENAEKLEDFSKEDRVVINKLNKFFWEEIYGMEAGRMLREVKVKDGLGKREALKEIIEKLEINPRDAMYVGDSITDALAFRYLRGKGGLTISFNGNKYALREAKIAVLSEDTMVTSILAYIFNHHGKEHVKEFVEEWGLEAIEEHCRDIALKEHISDLYVMKLPKVELISQDNMKQLTEASISFRKALRGEKIGGLG